MEGAVAEDVIKNWTADVDAFFKRVDILFRMGKPLFSGPDAMIAAASLVAISLHHQYANKKTKESWMKLMDELYDSTVDKPTNAPTMKFH